MADLSDELDSSSQAISDFVGDLGRAVAIGQKGLDENTALVAQLLSKTEVEIPALIQEVFDENTGLPVTANVVRTKVPMSTIVLPTAYNFSRVFFQADLKLEEFNRSKGVKLQRFAAKARADIKVDTSIASAVTGAVGGSASGSISTKEDKSRTDEATDRAAALLHFEATLEPRREIQVPAPLRSRIGPRVTVVITSIAITPMTASTGGTGFVPEDRKATVQIFIFKSNGAANSKTAAPNILYTVDAKELLVSSGGTPANEIDPIVLTVQRKQTTESVPLGAAIDTVVRVTLGGITEQIPLRL